jgi:hypothetical protein
MSWLINNKRRCFRAVDSMLEGSPKLIAIDEETKTLLAQLRGKRVNGLNLFREHPYLYWKFHYTDESSWR